MQTKHIFQGIGVAVLASAVWHYVGADAVSSWRRPPPSKPIAVKFQNDGPAPQEAAYVPSSAPKNIPMEVSGARKCRKGNTVVYTDRDCPNGTQEQTIEHGAITVVKAPQGGHKDAGGATTPRPTVRDMLTDPHEPSLRDRQVERVVNR